MAGGGDEIPAELFKILKDDALKRWCTQHVRKMGKLSSDQRTGKGQFSFQSQRRAVPKNVQTTIQLPLFCMLVRLCSKSFKLDFSNRWTEIFQIYKMGLEDRGTRYQIDNIRRIIEEERDLKKKSASLTAQKSLTLWITANCGKFWKRWGYQTTMDGDCSHEIKRHLLLGRKAIMNLDNVLKSRDIILLTKICIVKVMVFPIVMYGCESWTIEKSEHRTIDAFELWGWRRLLRVP